MNILGLLATVVLAGAGDGASTVEIPDAPVAVMAQGQGQGQGQGQARGRSDDRPQGQGQGQARGREDNGRAGERGQGRSGQTPDGPDRPVQAGGQGQGQGQGAQGQARGRADVDRPGQSGRAQPARGRSAQRARPHRPPPGALRSRIATMPEPVRRMAASSRHDERFVAGALARASLRGQDVNRLDVRRDDSRVLVRNRSGDVLLDLSRERAEELGHWRMRRLGDRQPTGGSPAFCRSGEGHPVWGRDWCLDKGFGLGVGDRTIWSRTERVGDIIFDRRPQRDLDLDRGGLIDVLGDIVFGRLALQSLALGYDAPLQGRWVASDERDAPLLLRVRAGDRHVAELVDRDRDGRVETLFVVQPRW